MEGKTADVGAAVKKAALKAMKKKPLPCGKKKKTNRVAIFSPWRKKMVSVEPYGATAKRLYRWYIQELDFDAGWIAPRLRHAEFRCGARLPGEARGYG